MTGLVSSSFPSFPQTKLFVHALKDELVKGALLAIHNRRSVNGSSSHIHSNGLPPDNTPANQEVQASPWQQDSERDTDYNEEEWASWSFSRIMFVMVVHLFLSVCLCVGQGVGECCHEPTLHHRYVRPAAGAGGPPSEDDIIRATGSCYGHKLREHR